MRWVQYQGSGTIAFDLSSRPSVAGTATVRTLAGAALTTPTPTLDSVNTTLSSAAAAGASSVSVASATGIVVGRRYLIGGAEATGGESVLVSSISGTTISLARPLARAKASGATFQSARISVAISSACTVEIARQYRVEWSDPDTGEVIAIPFDVTRYAPRSHLTESLLLDLDAALRKRLPSGAWVPALIERAWEMLLDDLGTKERHPGGYAGVIELTTAHAYRVRALVAETDTTAEGVLYRDDMRERFRQELDLALASVAYDTNQDGNAEVGKALWRGVPLLRS